MAYKSQKKVAADQRKQQALATDRSNRESIREAQLRRAMAIASASSMGALGGSAVAGGLGSLGSQLGSGLGFSSQMSGISRNIEKNSQSANTWSSIASIGGTVFQAVGGFDAFGKRADTSGSVPTPAPNNLMRDPYPGKAGR
jgi:hypothetical protein